MKYNLTCATVQLTGHCYRVDVTDNSQESTDIL